MYGLKELNLIKALVKASGMDKKGTEAALMSNWTDPKAGPSAGVFSEKLKEVCPCSALAALACLPVFLSNCPPSHLPHWPLCPSTMQHVFEKHCGIPSDAPEEKKKRLKVGKLNAWLDELADKRGDIEAQSKVLRNLMQVWCCGLVAGRLGGQVAASPVCKTR